MIKWQTARYSRSYGVPSQIEPAPACAEFAFIGRSNVGKSSLMNAIFERKSLVRVSSMPGKTMTVNIYEVGEAEKACQACFADLPGYGYAKRSQSEKERVSLLIDGYFKKRRPAVTFLLLDVRREASETDRDTAEFLRKRGQSVAIVLTKCDKLNKKQNEASEKAIREFFGESVRIMPTSAEKRAGIAEIRALIESECDRRE